VLGNLPAVHVQGQPAEREASPRDAKPVDTCVLRRGPLLVIDNEKQAPTLRCTRRWLAAVRTARRSALSLSRRVHTPYFSLAQGLAAPAASGPSVARRIAVLYVAIATLWIVFSDRVVAWLTGDAVTLGWLQTVKGLLYVFGTGLLLYVLVKRQLWTFWRSTEALRSVVESMADPVLIAAPGGRLVAANLAARALLGLDGQGPLGKRGRGIEEESAPEAPWHDALLQALEGRLTMGQEVALRRPDGSTLELSVSAAPVLGQQGTVELAGASLRDITGLHRLERVRDEFLSTAAHELKTPVAAIKGYVQLLRRWAPEGHDAREKNAFAVINRQCDRITRVVQELLEASRLQHGKLELHCRHADLSAIAAEVVERVRAVAPRHRLELERPKELWALVDPERIDTVLVHLIDNAVRYSAEGTRVLVRLAEDGGEATVSVTDEGMGIPADRRSRVFEPFFRARGELSQTVQEGIGIGLHVTREIVNRHGGRVWFESEEGKGSTFHFSVPLAGGPDGAGAQEGSGRR